MNTEILEGSLAARTPRRRRGAAAPATCTLATMVAALAWSSPANSACTIPAHVAASAYTVTRDIPYTTANDTTQSMDLYLPTNTTNPPVVFWIHGGSFVTGSKGGAQFDAHILATFGIATASLNYTLATAPTKIFPAGISDVRCAASFLVAMAPHFGVDPSRLAVIGESAGGNLGTLLALGANPNNAFSATANCAVPYSTPVFAGIADYYGLNDIGDPSAMNGAQTHIATNYLGVSPLKDQPLAAEASPITYVSAAAPPVFVARGTDDTTMPEAQATNLVAALQSNSVQNQYWDVSGLGHGFDPLKTSQSANLLPSACALIDFLKTVLKAPAHAIGAPISSH